MTLTEAAQLTKRSVVILILTLTTGFTARAAWTWVNPIIFPPKVPPPEVAFGKLPTLEIPNLPFEEGSGPEYSVDTKTGRLPQDLPERAKVYKIILPSVTHLTSQRAKDLAAKLDFSKDPQKISSSEYRWENYDEGRTLKMNITTGNFTLETDIKKLSNLSAGATPSKAAAVEQAKEFLENLEFSSEDYLEGRKEATYLKTDRESLKKVENLSEAQLTRVDLFREIDELPIVGNHPYEGLITVILGKDIVPFAFYSFRPLDSEQSTTYPLKTVEQVWDEVEEGKARVTFLALAKADPFSSYEPRGPKTVYIHRIFLGYFEGQKLQDYLQPIYILEGLGVTADRQQLKFIAYVPAVAYDWVEGKE